MTQTQLDRGIAIRAEIDALDKRRLALDNTYKNIYDIDPNTYQRHKADVIADLAAKRVALIAEFQAL